MSWLRSLPRVVVAQRRWLSAKNQEPPAAAATATESPDAGNKNQDGALARSSTVTDPIREKFAQMRLQVPCDLDLSNKIGTPPTLGPNAFPDRVQNFVTIDYHHPLSIKDVLPPREQMNPELASWRYPQFQIMWNPGRRTVETLKKDIELAKEGRMSRRDEEIFPMRVDIAIFGGGIMGSSIAYALKSRAPDSFTCAIFERDPKYTHASTTLSVGGIRQQFSLKENIEMAMYGADFLRNHKRYLSVLDDEPPDVAFNPHGYLFLASSEQGAEQILINHELQTEVGAYVDVLTPDQIKKRFPWISTDGIMLGAHGVQNEGWFDPWSLLIGMRSKAEFLGVQFVNAELLDFNMHTRLPTYGMFDELGDPIETCNYAIVRTPDGRERQVEFCYGVICTGPQAGETTKMLNIGTGRPGLRSKPLPVEPRKRYVYVFHCPDGPGVDFPLMIDPSGVYCRREGLGGNFICGKSPAPEDEPDPSNLDVDYTFFEREIWPVLARRVKAFENIKLVSAWAGYYDYNTLDQNAVIGKHPYYHNMVWACGFSGHGIQMGPAVGRAVQELILENKYETIDLSRFGWERIIYNQPLLEAMIV